MVQIIEEDTLIQDNNFYGFIQVDHWVRHYLVFFLRVRASQQLDFWLMLGFSMWLVLLNLLKVFFSSWIVAILWYLQLFYRTFYPHCLRLVLRWESTSFCCSRLLSLSATTFILYHWVIILLRVYIALVAAKYHHCSLVSVVAEKVDPGIYVLKGLLSFVSWFVLDKSKTKRAQTSMKSR